MSTKHSVFVIAMTILLLFGLPFLLLEWIDYKDSIPNPKPCDRPLETDEIHCTRMLVYDGLVEFSKFNSKRSDCCLFRRINLDEQRLSYFIRACSPNKQQINCSDYVGKNFRPELEIDYSWEGHEGDH